MSARKGFVLLLLLSALVFLAGCGSSGSGLTIGVAPPSGAFSNSNLDGTYVFSVSGTDFNGFAYAIVGTFTANGQGGNGKGGITGGSIDMNDGGFATSTPVVAPLVDSAISSNSTYIVGKDGRGTATLIVPANPFGGSITLDFVLQNSFHGLVTEFDDNATGSGTIDVVTPTPVASGSYAFSLSGSSVSSGEPFATAGNFSVGDGGSLSGLEDFNNSGLIAYPRETLSGILVLGPSTTTFTTLDTEQFGSLTFDVYPIDSTHFKFIETDTFAILSGDAYSQTSTAMPIGPMAFTLMGDLTGGPFAAGGFMVIDSGGTIDPTSTEDYNANGNVSPAPGTFSGAWAGGGTGRYTLGTTTFVGGSSYAAYPSSGGLLLLEIDTSGITTGAAYPQDQPVPTLAASQGYGLNLTGINLGASEEAQFPIEVDDIAEFTANSSGMTITGVIDENADPEGNAGFGAPFPGIGLSGTYVVPDSNGRGQVPSATACSGSNCTLNGGFALTFYSVDGTTFPFIETDNGQVAAGVFVLQDASATSPSLAKPHSMFVPRPPVRANAAKRKQVLKQK